MAEALQSSCALRRIPRARPIRHTLDGRWAQGPHHAMAISFNHTIVHSRDPRASADFLPGLFGLPPAVPFGPFLGVKVANGVTLDFLSADDMEVQMQHYAFLVGDDDFDAIFDRIKSRGVRYWADPGRTEE